MSHIARIFDKFFTRVLSFCSGLGSLWIGALVFVITLDVINRVIFNKPFQGTAEIVSNSIVIITFLQLAYVASIDAHVRSTMLVDKFPIKWKIASEIFSHFLGSIVFILLVYSSWQPFITALKIGEFEGEGALRVPVAPVWGIMILGSILLIIEYVRYSIKFVNKYKSADVEVKK